MTAEKDIFIRIEENRIRDSICPCHCFVESKKIPFERSKYVCLKCGMTISEEQHVRWVKGKDLFHNEQKT